MSRVVARFKEFLKVIKAHIVARLTKGNEGKENVRCITDGNEVMWFHCFGSTEDVSGCAWSFLEKKGNDLHFLWHSTP